MAGERYHTTAAHYMADGQLIPADVDIGEGTAFPLPDDWLPTLEVIPLNSAAQFKIKSTSATNVREIDDHGFLKPTLKSDPSLDPPDSGKPADAGTGEGAQKPKDTSGLKK